MKIYAITGCLSLYYSQDTTSTHKVSLRLFFFCVIDIIYLIIKHLPLSHNFVFSYVPLYFRLCIIMVLHNILSLLLYLLPTIFVLLQAITQNPVMLASRTVSITFSRHTCFIICPRICNFFSFISKPMLTCCSYFS